MGMIAPRRYIHLIVVVLVIIVVAGLMWRFAYASEEFVSRYNSRLRNMELPPTGEQLPYGGHPVGPFWVRCKRCESDVIIPAVNNKCPPDYDKYNCRGGEFCCKK